MNDLGLRSEGFEFSGDPVVESGSDGDEKIGLHHRHIGPVSPMHS